jgi:hypothetical protein
MDSASPLRQLDGCHGCKAPSFQDQPQEELVGQCEVVVSRSRSPWHHLAQFGPNQLWWVDSRILGDGGAWSMCTLMVFGFSRVLWSFEVVFLFGDTILLGFGFSEHHNGQ